MHARVLGRATAALAAVLVASTLLAPTAQADETEPPVAVGDTIKLYPGQSGQLDVLANDGSPSGDDLALCRFPEPDFLGAGAVSVFAMELSAFLGAESTGDLAVLVGPKARGTHVIDYFVCDTHHLVPAQLTVVVRDVAPVDVKTIPGRPGRLKVTNHNDRGIRFVYGDPRAHRPDGRVRVPAGATEVVRVQRHRIFWLALIGSRPGKRDLFSSPGIADHGRVRGIELRGEPLPAPQPPRPSFRGTEDFGTRALHRWAAAIG
jgi:hypothetical protein